MSDPVRRIRHWARRTTEAYQGDDNRPLGGYLALMGTYGASVALLAGAVRRSGRPLPERIGPQDLVLLGIASHKLSRILAKDPITSPLRAPFTTFEDQAGPSELVEGVRGEGWRHAVGELATCPFCLGQWVATGLVAGLVVAPRPTRLVGGLFATVALADAAQHAYALLQDASG